MRRFFVHGKPLTKQRPRFTKSGKVYTAPQTKRWEEQVGWAFKGSHPGTEPTDRLLRVELTFYRATRARTPHVDVDNLTKAVLDGLNGVAWKDDNQVVELHARKRGVWGDRPEGVEIVIKEL